MSLKGKQRFDYPYQNITEHRLSNDEDFHKIDYAKIHKEAI